jgi:hypothetical protein
MKLKSDKNNKTFNISINLKSFGSQSADLCGELIRLLQISGTKGHRSGLSKALGIIGAGLMEAAAKGPDWYASKRMAREDFTGKAIGYRPMRNAFDGLRQLGFIDYEHGYRPTSKRDPIKARAARFRAKPKYLDLAKSFGITPDNWMDHYSSGGSTISAAQPVALRSDSKWIPRGWKKDKIFGKEMDFDPAEPRISAIIRQVEEINAFMSGQDIRPAHWFEGFQRIFNQGDIPGFDWNKGGRLYALNGGYQQRTSDERAIMTINGEAVAEIDISASHLTIFHALQGLSIAGDAYDVPGVERLIVKAFVTMTLGRGSFHRRWPDEHKTQYREDRPGRELQKDFPIGKTRAKIVTCIPTLSSVAASGISWADLQFIESQAVIEAVHELAIAHCIAALPVHDSIIVPGSKKEIAAKVLSAMFERHVGIRPVLK